jgi:hypothetical protein
MKRWLLNKLLSHLFNAITEDDILVSHNGSLFRKGQALTNAEVEELRSGAASIRQMHVFQQLLTEMKHAANKRMYESSQTLDDMIFGKAVLWTVDIMEKKLINLSNLK